MLIGAVACAGTGRTGGVSCLVFWWVWRPFSHRCLLEHLWVYSGSRTQYFGQCFFYDRAKATPPLKCAVGATEGVLGAYMAHQGVFLHHEAGIVGCRA